MLQLEPNTELSLRPPGFWGGRNFYLNTRLRYRRKFVMMNQNPVPRRKRQKGAKCRAKQKNSEKAKDHMP
jgi:hypothetical protein